MIRAIVQNGLLRPLDPLPLNWAEGRIVIVEDAESAISDDLDEWYEELNRLGPAQYEPGEREQIQAILAEADPQAKEIRSAAARWDRPDGPIPLLDGAYPEEVSDQSDYSPRKHEPCGDSACN